MSMKFCRIHLRVVLGLPAKNGVKIPSVAWGTEVVPPRKIKKTKKYQTLSDASETLRNPYSHYS